MSAPPLNAARIRAVTLDLDDTLWPVWPTIERAEDALRRWLDAHAPATARLARDPDTARRARQQVLADLAGQTHDLGLIRRQMIRQLLDWAGEPPRLAEPAFEVFFAARQQVSLFDDALPALQRLGARYPLVALSNGNADVQLIGIGQHFHAAISAAQVGVAKPDPRIFAAAAQAAGVPADAVLHIGDDAALDAAGALGAGMQAAWINRTGAAWPAEHEQAPHAAVIDLMSLCRMLA